MRTNIGRNWSEIIFPNNDTAAANPGDPVAPPERHGFYAS
jgi:hypothetical protein